MSAEPAAPGTNRYGHVIYELRDRHHCPYCRRVVTEPVCSGCGANLAGEEARRLLETSEQAASALEARHQALTALLAARSPLAQDVRPANRVPQPAATTGAPTARPVASPGAWAPPPAAARIASPGAGPAAPLVARQRTEVNQVAVFSAVGVGALVAAAMVFAWLVPLDPRVVRAVLLVVTALAIVATLWLRRRRPVSAAAIAVGVVALGLLDVNLLSTLFSPANRWYFSAAGVGVVAVALGLAGFWLRLRPWVSAAVLLAPVAVWLVVPGLTGRLHGTDWYWQAAGLIVAGAAVAAIGHPAARLWQPVSGRPSLGVERRLLAVAAGLALLLAGGMAAFGSLGRLDAWGGAILLGCAVAAWLHSRSGNDQWRTTAGIAATLAGPTAVASFGVTDTSSMAAAWAGWLVLAGLSWLPTLQHRQRLAGALRGGFGVALLLTIPPATQVAVSIGDAALRVAEGSVAVMQPLTLELSAPVAAWAVTAVAAAAAGLLAASLLPHDRAGEFLPRTGRALWAWLALAACVGAVLLPVLAAPVQVWLLLALAAGCGIGVWWSARRGRPLTGPVLAAHDLGGQAVLALAVYLSWTDRVLTLAAGGAGVVMAVAWKLFVNRRWRHALIGGAYAYTLTLLGHGLWWFPPTGQAPDAFMVFGLLGVVANVLAVAVAAVPRVPGRYWFVLLGVSCLPWAVSIGLDLSERTWWTAAAAASLLVAEVVVFTTGRRAVPGWLRVTVAALFLPTICVVVINAGAMLIDASGSPYLLPVVAVASALVAVAAAPWGGALAVRGMAAGLAGRVRIGLEGSALACAVAAVVLSVWLRATGPETTLVVCAILGVGAAVVAIRSDRRWVWWLAGLAFAGVLWSALALWQVTLVEWYTVPVALAALATGVALTARTSTWWPLPMAGLQLALWPTLVLAIAGGDVVWRGLALAGAALVLAAVALQLRGRKGLPARRLLAVTGSGVAVAGVAPVVVAAWAARIIFGGSTGSGNEWLVQVASGLADNPDRVFFAVVGVASVAVGFYAWAGQVVHWAADRSPWRRSTASWRFAPALVVAAAILVLTIALAAPALPSPTEFFRPAFGWPVVWFMWAACLGFLGLTILATWLRLPDRVLLPPAWLCWLVALAVGIAGWSLRLLRVEFHALPLGLVLFACGLLVWRDAVREQADGRPTPGDHPDADSQPVPGHRPGANRDPALDRRPRLSAWPNGFTEPSHLLVPGTLATLAPSTLAIWTDPQTWRAILVLVLALAFLLVGARKLWQPVMVSGIADLAIAIVLVFVARQGSIDWVPWMIALVGAGGMLLGLAIYAERRRDAVPDTSQAG